MSILFNKNTLETKMSIPEHTTGTSLYLDFVEETTSITNALYVVDVMLETTYHNDPNIEVITEGALSEGWKKFVEAAKKFWNGIIQWIINMKNKFVAWFNKTFRKNSKSKKISDKTKEIEQKAEDLMKQINEMIEQGEKTLSGEDNKPSIKKAPRQITVSTDEKEPVENKKEDPVIKNSSKLSSLSDELKELMASELITDIDITTTLITNRSISTIVSDKMDFTKMKLEKLKSFTEFVSKNGRVAPNVVDTKSVSDEEFQRSLANADIERLGDGNSKMFSISLFNEKSTTINYELFMKSVSDVDSVFKDAENLFNHYIKIFTDIRNKFEQSNKDIDRLLSSGTDNSSDKAKIISEKMSFIKKGQSEVNKAINTLISALNRNIKTISRAIIEINRVKEIPKLNRLDKINKLTFKMAELSGTKLPYKNEKEFLDWMDDPNTTLDLR